ncbi:MAG: AMP-binding protein [Pseudorhodoplanes sp.]
MTGPGVEIEHRADGSILMRNPQPLGPYPRILTERLTEALAACPARVFLGERDENGAWRTITYAEALAKVRALGQALLDNGLSRDRPLAILSGGSLAHALMALAASHVGIPYCPVSPAYSLVATNFEKLSHVIDVIRPGMVFVENYDDFAPALERIRNDGIRVVANRAAPVGALSLAQLAETTPTTRVDEAHRSIAPDDVRSILFTSGTTGRPKGVITTHRMTTANQQMFLQTFPEFGREPPVVLSWLPWHHTSGANSILGAVLYNLGTLWIDNGRPVDGPPMQESIRNLREIAPTAYFTAPSGFRLLAKALRDDHDLRRTFFSRLSFFFYSGSAMPEALAHEMDAISKAETGRHVPFYSCYGATETAPFALAVNWPGASGGLVGLPMQGVTLKLAPRDGSRVLEARLKGPSVTPGYWRDAAATEQAFDEEGYYRYGDALAPLDPNDLSKGLVFDGRIGENFKLATGTWVNVAGLRDRLMTATKGCLVDAVIAGEGQMEVGALLFPNPTFGGDAMSLRAEVAAALREVATGATGSSTFIARALLLSAPPDSAAGEMTDKGAVSQKAVLRNRAHDIARLFGEPRDPEVISPDSAGQVTTT